MLCSSRPTAGRAVQGLAVFKWESDDGIREIGAHWRKFQRFKLWPACGSVRCICLASLYASSSTSRFFQVQRCKREVFIPTGSLREKCRATAIEVGLEALGHGGRRSKKQTSERTATSISSRANIAPDCRLCRAAIRVYQVLELGYLIGRSDSTAAFDSCKRTRVETRVP